MQRILACPWVLLSLAACGSQSHSMADAGMAVDASAADARVDMADASQVDARESEDAGGATGSIELDRRSDGVISGRFLRADGASVISFQAERIGEGARAHYDDLEASLDVEVTSMTEGTMTYAGVTWSGKGELSSEADIALSKLAESELVHALALVPLDLGCREHIVDRAELSALLLPWQMILKYRDPSRTETVAAYASTSDCAYFVLLGETTDKPEPKLLPLGFDDPVPSVFGYFSFDAVGAIESMAALGDLHGPCQALCRGACGPDCPSNNCKETLDHTCEEDANGHLTGMKQPLRVKDCGTHPGCQTHDDCYDGCNAGNGCGTWNAAVCRRGCDADAVAAWGVGNGSSWAGGGGPYTASVQFKYPDGAAVYDPGVCTESDAGLSDAGAMSSDGGLFDALPSDGGLFDARPSDGGSLADGGSPWGGGCGHSDDPCTMDGDCCGGLCLGGGTCY